MRKVIIERQGGDWWKSTQLRLADERCIESGLLAHQVRGISMAGNWHKARAEAVASGTEEAWIADAKSQLEDQIRAYFLTEIRQGKHLTQAQVARRLGVGQQRISQIERGNLDRTEVVTLRAYVEALGGQLEVSATFGERRLRIA
jgi:DNA-binding XRE family transcriptional regulator